MSCTASQFSKDDGEGRGSTWTNFFIAKGNMEPGYDQRGSYTKFISKTFNSKDSKGEFKK